jgi:nitrate/nitrite transporter NarK
VFVVFGLLGIIWVFAWHRIFRDEPSEHPDVNEAEAALIVAGREPTQPSAHEGWPYWRRLIAHRNTWPLCFAYVANSFAFYFCITWLPTYLHEQHGIAGGSLGLLSGLPLLVAVLGDLGGGALTDWAVARFGLRAGRVGVCCLGYGAAGLTMLAATSATTPLAAVGLISLAVGATMLTLGATWGVCQEIGGAHVGVVGAAMNTVGQLGGIAGPPLVTWLAKTYDNWNAPIVAIGAYALLGAALWCLVDPRAKVFD